MPTPEEAFQKWRHAKGMPDSLPEHINAAIHIAFRDGFLTARNEARKERDVLKQALEFYASYSGDHGRRAAEALASINKDSSPAT